MLLLAFARVPRISSRTKKKLLLARARRRRCCRCFTLRPALSSLLLFKLFICSIVKHHVMYDQQDTEDLVRWWCRS